MSDLVDTQSLSLFQTVTKTKYMNLVGHAVLSQKLVTRVASWLYSMHSNTQYYTYHDLSYHLVHIRVMQIKMCTKKCKISTLY